MPGERRLFLLVEVGGDGDDALAAAKEEMKDDDWFGVELHWAGWSLPTIVETEGF